MIGDKIVVKAHHLPPAEKIVDLTIQKIENSQSVFVFTVSGESGCGKSTLAIALEMLLDKRGFNTYIFHMDDYFVLPPSSNHNNRLLSIENVGPHEVNLDLLQSHIDALKKGVKKIDKPLVHYKDNKVHTVNVEFNDVKVIIVEGTYTTLMNNVDCKIFLERTYKDTYEQRSERGREEMSDFIESVLEIEHKIISSHKIMADLLVDNEYNVNLFSN
jgi:VCBS repeat-containing protein